ncbi:MAG TPA: MAPEG family protein [Rhizomicrobium sp.]|nr:MAPEG family protein [Rhizomicrobium sp.]
MELASHAVLLTAIVTIVAILLYFYMGIRVGQARTKYNCPAPTMVGDPAFERAQRIQLNTLEALPIFLPLLWLATLYFTMFGWLPAAFGVVWIVGRFIYMTGYSAAADKRSTGFLIQLVAQLALLIMAVWGIVVAWGAS